MKIAIRVILILCLVILSISFLYPQTEPKDLKYVIGRIDTINSETNSLSLIDEEDGGLLGFIYDPQYITVWLGDEKKDIGDLKKDNMIEISYYLDKKGANIIDSIDIIIEPITAE